MVNLESWTGGNLNETEDLSYSWQHTISGWTVSCLHPADVCGHVRGGGSSRRAKAGCHGLQGKLWKV